MFVCHKNESPVINLINSGQQLFSYNGKHLDFVWPATKDDLDKTEVFKFSIVSALQFLHGYRFTLVLPRRWLCLFKRFAIDLWQETICISFITNIDTLFTSLLPMSSL
jgi:hypothetical protein